MQIKVDFLCRDSILAAPLVLDLALFMDFAARASMYGIQEWISFYYKSPMAAEGLYSEHDLFIQRACRLSGRSHAPLTLTRGIVMYNHDVYIIGGISWYEHKYT